jgi:hypothetical protein
MIERIPPDVMREIKKLKGKHGDTISDVLRYLVGTDKKSTEEGLQVGMRIVPEIIDFDQIPTVNGPMFLAYLESLRKNFVVPFALVKMSEILQEDYPNIDWIHLHIRNVIQAVLESASPYRPLNRPPTILLVKFTKEKDTFIAAYSIIEKKVV